MGASALVNARNMKNVPGRRTDWHECQWLQFLHSVGLLRAAFRPDGDVVAVRSLMRHRTDLTGPLYGGLSTGADGCPAHSTHAKIADADESANPSRNQRNHGRDWFSDCRRHHWGTAR